jgi:hypothetical protein
MEWTAQVPSSIVQISSVCVWGYSMEGMHSVDWLSDLLSWFVAAAKGGVWQLLTVQNAISLVSTGVAIWKWWEAREANLFLRFERMIARNEHKLVGARSDLLDVMNRPGPGVLIRTPLFITWKLRAVLHRRKWHPTCSGRSADSRPSLGKRPQHLRPKGLGPHGASLLLQRADRLSASHPRGPCCRKGGRS